MKMNSNMICKVPLVCLLFVSLFLITSAYKLNPPTNYTWPQNTNKICFAGHFDLVLNVEYTQSNGQKVSVAVPLDNKTYETYSASCSAPNNMHELTISMLGGFSAIIFDFFVDENNSTSLKKVYGYVTFNDKQSFFKNYSDDMSGVHKFSSNQSLFTAGRGNSFRCNTQTVITGFETNQNVTVKSINIENLLVQPFIDDSTDFNVYGVEQVCAADIDKNSNLIPIIVGACLGVLVVVVLIAYLIGRRHSRNGYQSV